MMTQVLRLTRWELFKLRKRWMPWILLGIVVAITPAHPVGQLCCLSQRVHTVFSRFRQFLLVQHTDRRRNRIHRVDMQ